MSFLRPASAPTSTAAPANPRHALFNIEDLSRLPRSTNEAIIRSLCKVAYVGRSTALCRMLGRYKIYVDTQDFGLAPHIMLDGYWEMWLTEVIAKSIKPGMVVADIGANIGYYTLLMAELVGPNGMVHAFEPNPLMAERAATSVSLNGFRNRVAVHNVALGEHDGEQMAFIIPPNEPKNAFLARHDSGALENGTLIHTQRLDSSPSWSDIEFAKIDVEGAEQLIWAGAKGLLNGSRLKTVVLEFAGARYGNPEKFLDDVLAPGFCLSYVDMEEGIKSITREEVLANNPNEDILLFLQR
jgi:FkbM family methyltransferase